MHEWIIFNAKVPHIGTIIIQVGNIGLIPHGIQAIPIHKSKDQA